MDDTMAIGIVFLGIPIPVPDRINVDLGDKAGVSLQHLIHNHMPAHEEMILGDVLLDGENLKPDYFILVNGRNYLQLQGLETFVEDGSEIVFAALVDGG